MKILIYLTILLHYFAVLCLGISFVLAPFIFPWYFGLTVSGLISRIPLSRDPCPITLLENYFRRKAGVIEVKGFTKEYLLSLEGFKSL